MLSIDIGIWLVHLADKTGLTAGDLKGLEAECAPEVFWPASMMIIEEWATHRVVRDYSGLRKVIYAGWNNDGRFDPFPIWQHELPRADGDRSPAYLELVLHEGAIKVWARDGRFGFRNPWTSEPQEKYVLAVIPMNEEALPEYRAAEDKATWIRHYEAGRDGQTVWWRLTVNDVVAYVGR